MRQSSNEMYGAIVDSVLRITEQFKLAVADKPTSLSELADKLFAFRESIKRLEELRKTLSQAEELYEKTFTMIWLASSNAPDKIKTEFVTAESVPKLGLRVPRAHEPAYGALMTFLGVPAEVQQHGALTFYFPGLCEYYTALQAAGLELPVEIKDSITEYEMSYVKTIKRQSMQGTFHVEET